MNRYSPGLQTLAMAPRLGATLNPFDPNFWKPQNWDPTTPGTFTNSALKTAGIDPSPFANMAQHGGSSKPGDPNAARPGEGPGNSHSVAIQDTPGHYVSGTPAFDPLPLWSNSDLIAAYAQWFLHHDRPDVFGVPPGVGGHSWFEIDNVFNDSNYSPQAWDHGAVVGALNYRGLRPQSQAAYDALKAQLSAGGFGAALNNVGTSISALPGAAKNSVDSLSTGAKIGIGAGVVVGGALLYKLLKPNERQQNPRRRRPKPRQENPHVAAYRRKATVQAHDRRDPKPAPKKKPAKKAAPKKKSSPKKKTAKKKGGKK